jgi:hypothetical protein
LDLPRDLEFFLNDQQQLLVRESATPGDDAQASEQNDEAERLDVG